MKVILISGKAQHGKTSTAIIAEKHMKNAGLRVVRISYADYVKFICEKYYGWNGKKDEQGRYILQHVGTDIFRARDESFWVDTVIRFASVVKPDYDFMLVDDWRFPNEYTRWAEKGIDYVIRVRVYRPGYDNRLSEDQKNHSSEIALDSFPMDYKLFAVNLIELEMECIKILTSINI